MKTISLEFINHGFGAVRFDFTWLADREGDVAKTNFLHSTSDLIRIKSLNEFITYDTIIKSHKI